MVGAAVDYVAKLEHLLDLLDERSIDVEVWLLGNGIGNSKLAARFGTAFAFGRPDADSTVLEEYRAEFKASRRHATSQDLLSVIVVCADTERNAVELAWNFYRQEGTDPRPTRHVPAYLAPALQACSSLKEPTSAVKFFPYMVVGDPATVCKQLEALGDFFGVSEFVISTIPALDFKTRLRSYELIAAAFGLSGHR